MGDVMSRCLIPKYYLDIIQVLEYFSGRESYAVLIINLAKTLFATIF